MSTAIPYIDENHPITGLTNAKLGIWLFLASEVMLFGALFSSYLILKMGAPTWLSGREVLDLRLGSLNTLILIASSVTMLFANRALNRREFSKFKWLLIATLALSLAFLAIKGLEYQHKFNQGVFPSTHNFYALYFTLTGFHALHILGGILVNGYFLTVGAKLWQTRPRQYTGRLECASLYWYFVDVVWVFLFVTLYLL